MTPTAIDPGRAQPVDVADFRRIQNTPKWTTSGTLDYSTPVGAGELSASTTVSYRSKTFQFETPSPFLDQKGYALVDASLVWKSEGGVSLGLHGKNLLDKQYKTSGYQFLAVNPVTGVPLRNARRQRHPEPRPRRRGHRFLRQSAPGVPVARLQVLIDNGDGALGKAGRPVPS